MPWKVNYEKNGKIESLYYGNLVTVEEKKIRLKKLRELGCKILSCYKVKKI